VRQALMDVDGVVSADVSYEEEQAAIRYYPELTNPDEMISAIDASGFTASLLK
jgi:copper chaperone CopZ